MTISEFIELCTDMCGCVVYVYDFTSEKNVFWTEDVNEILHSDYAEYEIESFDVYQKSGVIKFSFNITIDGDN